MPPKFQSSFIPKGPVTTLPKPPSGRSVGRTSFLSFIATILFGISLLAALGVFGYKLYLNNRIEDMIARLEAAKNNLQTEVIDELVRLDRRMKFTNELVIKHEVMTPVFEFIQQSTPSSVRFSEFNYEDGPGGPTLEMVGEARSYSALALQSDVFAKSPYFKEFVFSDLSLNEKGEVVFSFNTKVDTSLISYTRDLEQAVQSVTPPINQATSSPNTN